MSSHSAILSKNSFFNGQKNPLENHFPRLCHKAYTCLMSVKPNPKRYIDSKNIYLTKRSEYDSELNLSHSIAISRLMDKWINKQKPHISFMIRGFGSHGKIDDGIFLCFTWIGCKFWEAAKNVNATIFFKKSSAFGLVRNLTNLFKLNYFRFSNHVEAFTKLFFPST